MSRSDVIRRLVSLGAGRHSERRMHTSSMDSCSWSCVYTLDRFLDSPGVVGIV